MPLYKRDMAKKTTYNLALIENRIKKAMKDQGTYSRPMDIVISLAAGTYYSFLAARDSLISDSLIKTEISRERHKRYIVSPAYDVMITSAELMRKYLRELRLTRATIEGEADTDDLTDLEEQVKEVKNGIPTKLKRIRKDG
jgi:hypothetical protein